MSGIGLDELCALWNDELKFETIVASIDGEVVQRLLFKHALRE